MKRLLTIALLSFAAYSAHAREGLLNKLLSPGPLIEGHKELEVTDCLKCHELNKGVPDSKCLDCHKEIRTFITRKTGYHGMTGKQCIACHSDHKGTTFDSTKINLKSFDHKLTGFLLTGKHKDIKCEDCHTETRAKMKTRKGDPHFLGLGTACVDCHKKDDPHFFSPPSSKFKTMSCGECHNDTDWKKNVRFNHDKDTKYKLEGKHLEIKCDDCHKTKSGDFKYLFPEMKTEQCLACHEDQHKNKLEEKFRGGDCLKCHTMQTWKMKGKAFDHSITGFKLNGKHADIKCIECHKQATKNVADKDLNYKGLKQDCLSCHENFHHFSNQPGRKLGNLLTCKECHAETNWKSDFNHNTQTAYPISGKHLKLKCDDCHTPDPANKKFRIYNWSHFESKTCETCHASPHLKTFSKENLAKRCTECHVDTGWKVSPKDFKNLKGKKFNHDTATRFPLDGRHANVSCADCHSVKGKNVYKFPSADKKFCIDCHSSPHLDQFSKKFQAPLCAECHNASAWDKLLPFKHELTRFKLTGKHLTTKCEDCHTQTDQKFANKPYHYKGKFLFENADKSFCISCHQNVHSKQFHEKYSQQSCVTCHTTESFAKQKTFDHFQTLFPLRGMHEELSCDACHTATQNRFPKSKSLMHTYVWPHPHGQCINCHKDPHRNEYGKDCASCHLEDFWANQKNFHKNFTLKGAHEILTCAECHTDGKRLSGMSDNCVGCHQKDDVHGGTLRNCKDCHRQNFWENASFKHNLSRFPLRGAHRTLDCVACHSTGVYKGLQTTCVSCHRQTALSFTGTPNHALLLDRACSECHNQFSFR